MKRLGLLLALVPLAAGGCAVSAKKPDSPATHIKVTDLEATPPPPGERYYVIVYGSQSTPRVPKYTHTWATVVRTAGAVGTAPGTVLEHHTISWMPATLDIHPWRFRVEPGVNLDMKQSLDVMFGNGERVSVWGPYEVRPGMYQKFLLQKAFLDSGEVGYQCIDSVGESARTGRGSDCYHAISDSDVEYNRSRYPLLRYGESASLHVVKQFQSRRVLYDPGVTHDWVLTALGIDSYPIIRRTYHGVVRPAERP